MKLPSTQWTPLYVPNPNRKWWQFWKPRFIWNPDHPIASIFTEHNKIMDDLPWKEATDAHQ